MPKVCAHIKAQKLRDVAYEKTYSRAYDRLKHRKSAGTINTKTRNKLVVEIQNIRDDARADKFSDAEAVEKSNKY